MSFEVNSDVSFMFSLSFRDTLSSLELFVGLSGGLEVKKSSINCNINANSSGEM